MAPVLEVSEGMLRHQLAVNVEGLFFTLQAVARTMVERGQGGKIINMASQAGRRGEALVSAYCASKAAVIGMIDAYKDEYAEKGITINAVAPGFIETDMTAAIPEDHKSAMLNEIPLARFGAPADVARAAAFLAGESAGYITGQTLVVDGGMTM